jgi:hypothetical protein
MCWRFVIVVYFKIEQNGVVMNVGLQSLLTNKLNSKDVLKL